MNVTNQLVAQARSRDHIDDIVWTIHHREHIDDNNNNNSNNKDNSSNDDDDDDDDDECRASNLLYVLCTVAMESLVALYVSRLFTMVD